MTDNQQAHIAAAMGYMEVAQTSALPMEIQEVFFTNATDQTERILKEKPDIFLQSAMQQFKDSPVGGDGRHDQEALDMAMHMSMLHTLYAYPDHGDDIEDGWGVDITGTDMGGGNPWADAYGPTDADHAKRIVETMGLRFNRIESHGDGYFTTIVGLPTDMAIWLRRTGLLYLELRDFEGDDWYIHTEVDPR